MCLNPLKFEKPCSEGGTLGLICGECVAQIREAEISIGHLLLG